mgnify:CR=1 FL=1
MNIENQTKVNNAETKECLDHVREIQVHRRNIESLHAHIVWHEKHWQIMTNAYTRDGKRIVRRYVKDSPKICTVYVAGERENHGRNALQEEDMAN